MVYLLATRIFDLLEGKLPAEFKKKYGLSWNLLKASIGDERGRTKLSEVNNEVYIQFSNLVTSSKEN